MPREIEEAQDERGGVEPGRPSPMPSSGPALAEAARAVARHPEPEAEAGTRPDSADPGDPGGAQTAPRASHAFDRACLDAGTRVALAYLSHPSAKPTPADVRHVLGSIADFVRDLARGVARREVEDAALPLVPPVPIERSYSDTGTMCFECGKTFKLLRRHLSLDHGMTELQYRAKWALPADYPMVAPAYSKARAEAKGRVRSGRVRPGSAEATDDDTDPAPARRPGAPGSKRTTRAAAH